MTQREGELDEGLRKTEPFVFLVIFCIVICVVAIFLRNNLYHLQRVGRWTDKASYLKSDTPLWKQRKRRFKAADDESRVFSLDVIDYRSPFEDTRYGVEATLETRTRQLGLVRRVKRYQRQSVIQVPEISKDSNKCDAWAISGKDQEGVGVFANSQYLTECNLGEGDTACYKCIEARKFVRSCLHFPQNVTVTRKDGTSFTIPSNADQTKGWCLPENFKNIRFEKEAVVPGGDTKRNCNPLTGTWLLSQLGQEDEDGEIKFDSSYNWICKCRYPNLMTNLTTVMSDCMKPVGCGAHGHLDEVTARGEVDPYARGACVCDKGYVSAFEESVGPTCVPTNIGNTDTLDNLYKEYGLKMGRTLRRDYIDKNFLTLFDRNIGKRTSLPDPCKVDVLTGKETNGCEATLWTLNKKPTVFCQSSSNNHLAVKTNTDYLLNNQGKYPNACLKLFDPKTEWESGVAKDGNELPTVLSFYNGKQHPDVGIVVQTFFNKSRVRELYKELWDRDSTLRDWYSKNVQPYRDPGRWDLLYGLNNLANDNTIIVFEDHPANDKTYLTNQLRRVYGFESGNFKKSILSYGHKYDEYYREYYGVKDTWWWNQTLAKYNSVNNIGRVPVGPLYLNYFRQNENNLTYRGTIQYATPAYPGETTYPPPPFRCLFCDDTGSLSGEYVKQYVIPKLYPVLYDSFWTPLKVNRKFQSFDACLTFYWSRAQAKQGYDNKGVPELHIFAERFMRNFKGYQQNALKL